MARHQGVRAAGGQDSGTNTYVHFGGRRKSMARRSLAGKGGVRTDVTRLASHIPRTSVASPHLRIFPVLHGGPGSGEKWGAVRA